MCVGLCMGEICFFFFSSRRRHTILTCDWSSDVCSSDLVQLIRGPEGTPVQLKILRDDQIVDAKVARKTLVWDPVETTALDGGAWLLTVKAFNDNTPGGIRSEEHTSELQSHVNLVCRLLL